MYIVKVKLHVCKNGRPHPCKNENSCLPGVILLVDPDKEVFVVIMPDSTCVRPVTGHTTRQQQRGDRFVKQEVIFDQFFLCLLSHSSQGVVGSCITESKDCAYYQ